MQQTTIKYGIITGIASVLYLLFFYMLNKTNAINPFINLGSLLIVVVGMVVAGRKQRELNGGNLERKEALKIAFSIAVISGLFFYLFLYLLFNVIDTELNAVLQQKAIEAGTIKENDPYFLSFGNVMMGYAFSLLYGFLLALMVANFIKR